jgi:hypothetical protein
MKILALAALSSMALVAMDVPVPAPARVYFAFQIGGTRPASQDVAVTSTLAGMVFNVRPDSSWLKSNLSQAVTPATLRLSADPSGLAAGTYTATIPLPGSGGITAILTVLEAAAWPQVFTDVASSNLFFEHVRLLKIFGVTLGCNDSPPLYCPDTDVTRGQMAAFMIRALFGLSSFSYSQGPYYTDVPTNHEFFPYIQKATDMGLLVACAPSKFCMDTPIVRRDMAVALVRSLFGESFVASSAAYFTDVPSSSSYFKYVQKLRDIGTTDGCGPTLFCPDSTVTRWQMAGFLARQYFGWKQVPPTDRAMVGQCNMFPPDNVWNTPIDKLPVHASSATFVTTIGANTGVHPDFGSGLWDGGKIGIPYIVVPGSQARVPISFYYPDESDPGPYPIPADAPIEGGSDHHVLIVDRASCKLYEVYDATAVNGGANWTSGSGAVFDLNSNALRPATWTSADAAGLPILPGLVRYEEVAAGEIRHAVRFTAPATRNQFIWPARHQASSRTGANYPPMGLRFRLKASVDISRFSTESQVIMRALKKYGMILADNGSSWYISGVPDERWDNDNLVGDFGRLHGSDFEAVDESSLQIDDTARAKQQ